MRYPFLLLSLMVCGGWAVAPGQNRYEGNPVVAEDVTPTQGDRSDPYPWKVGIVTTIFWVGERPGGHNPVANRTSAWDKHWSANYGGYDNPDPAARRYYIPVRFVPRQNPFYFALPYNDVVGHHTKREAAWVIPWFNEAFVRDGQSVLKDRWIAIRHGDRVCYAQWEDCGPFRTDHWQYVFGHERPRPNLNQGAGLDVSPAVRDYLGLAPTKDVCDWKFVAFTDVPSGPWLRYGQSRRYVLARSSKGRSIRRPHHSVLAHRRAQGKHHSVLAHRRAQGRHHSVLAHRRAQGKRMKRHAAA